MVEDMLRAWTAMCSADGDDVVMDDGEAVDREFDVLRQCVEEYRERIDANPWIRELVATL